ncbi:30S ribosomal protein S5 [bacterium]|nr:30S ribosomal protein S5 [bacterium]MBT4251553.1 30S ribosomal protein S5 [bacterium]MBT6753539.1 30S ribosomal protein S5 [bacterium]MBT7037733.1 30S ribosomal protein S5 [bacterium]MBT7431986.1 30S ribosomal protein S5 [bacterium]
METTQQDKGKKRFSRNNKKRRFQKREKPEFEQKLLDLARVTRVVKGGRRFSFRASVVIGDRKGKVGFGVSKGADVSIAIGKAFAAAKKNMIIVKRTNTTIAFDIKKKFGAARIIMRPAKEGRGIVAGGAMRSVFELAGVKDIVAKSLGSSNKINVARATMAALEELGAQLVGKGPEKKEISKKKEGKPTFETAKVTSEVKKDDKKEVSQKTQEKKVAEKTTKTAPKAEKKTVKGKKTDK